MKNDFATKADLKQTAEALHHDISAVRTDLTKTENGLRHEIETVRNELNQKIDSVNVSLKKDIECLAVQVIHVSTELGDLKREFVDFKQETGERFDGVMTAIDGLAGLIKNGRTEKAAVDHALVRHDTLLADHESRIGVLEQK